MWYWGCLNYLIFTFQTYLPQGSNRLLVRHWLHQSFSTFVSNLPKNIAPIKKSPHIILENSRLSTCLIVSHLSTDARASHLLGIFSFVPLFLWLFLLLLFAVGFLFPFMGSLPLESISCMAFRPLYSLAHCLFRRFDQFFRAYNWVF